jgi:hypothetical protein
MHRLGWHEGRAGTFVSVSEVFSSSVCQVNRRLWV